MESIQQIGDGFVTTFGPMVFPFLVGLVFGYWLAQKDRAKEAAKPKSRE